MKKSMILLLSFFFLGGCAFWGPGENTQEGFSKLDERDYDEALELFDAAIEDG